MICFVLQSYGTPCLSNFSPIVDIKALLHDFAIFLQLLTLLEFLESRTPPTLLSPRLLPSCPTLPHFIFQFLECLLGFLITANVTEKVYEVICTFSFDSDATPITRHEDFRLFACMNPATDVGKKDLPPGIRNRFVNFLLLCQLLT